MILRAAFDATEKVDTLHFMMDTEIRIASVGMTMLITLEGDLQAPDRFQGTLAMSLGFLEFEMQTVIIGETTYVTNPEADEWEIDEEGGQANWH